MATASKTGWTIGSISWKDVADVLAIDRICSAVPMDEDSLIETMRKADHIGLCCKDDDSKRTAGFIIYRLFGHTLRVVRHGALQNLRGTIAMNKLISRMIEKLSQQQRDTITIWLREKDLDGQLFLQSKGFRATQISGESYKFVYTLE